MSKNATELKLRFDAGEELDADDLRYLRDRNLLSDDQIERLALDEEPLASRSRDLNQIANTGDANTHGYTVEELEQMLEKARKTQGAPKHADEDDEDDEEEIEDYDEGWNNDSRRAELSRRGLPVEGNKEQLIERLIRDDAARKE